MPEVIKKIHGRRYRYHYKWEKAGGKWKKVWTYLGSAEATYSTHRFFAGGFGFVLKALMGQLPAYPNGVEPRQIDEWAKYRQRMDEDEWARYAARFKTARAVLPASLAEHVARKDLPGYILSYAVSYATDFRYENWYAQRVAEVQAWRADQETRKEEIAEKRAQTLSNVQPPADYVDMVFLNNEHGPQFSRITLDGLPALDSQPLFVEGVQTKGVAAKEPEAAPDILDEAPEAAPDTAPDVTPEV